MSKKFIPALRFGWLTPLFDPFLRWTLPEATLKKRLIETAGVTEEHHVLDLGCGTGTLAILLKHTFPKAQVVGVDIDPKILKIAAQKVRLAELKVQLDQGPASALPYPDEAFDRVLSSLVMHHLTLEQKRQAFKEVWRVLKPNGEFWILDFGQPHNIPMYMISLVFRWFEETHGHIVGKIPGLLQEAGFKEVKIEADFSTWYGTLSLFKAQKD